MMETPARLGHNLSLVANIEYTYTHIKFEMNSQERHRLAESLSPATV